MCREVCVCECSERGSWSPGERPPPQKGKPSVGSTQFLLKELSRESLATLRTDKKVYFGYLRDRENLVFTLHLCLLIFRKACYQLGIGEILL